VTHCILQELSFYNHYKGFVSTAIKEWVRHGLAVGDKVRGAHIAHSHTERCMAGPDRHVGVDVTVSLRLTRLLTRTYTLTLSLSVSF
jgi:hypothetical protein